MTTQQYDLRITESFEYHGNTAIEHVRKNGGITIARDWILFDSVEEAETFFNEHLDERQAMLH